MAHPSLSTLGGQRTVVIVFILLLALNLLRFAYNDNAAHYTNLYRKLLPGSRPPVESSTEAHGWSRNSSPGHMGSAVRWDEADSEVASFVQAGIQLHGFNEYASALVPLRRALPDLRDTRCVDRGNTTTLPKTSIVIVFYNEPWSSLARTVHSVLDNTPAGLFDEILLVDDSSTLPHLKTQLDEYFRSYANVRILRATERLGLIRARMLGARNTRAPLLTFLDAHVECTTGWLEPLLAEVVRNGTTIAVPLIDRIDDNDMHLIRNVSSQLLGAFEWDLNFGWWYRSTFPARPQPSTTTEPFEAPAMAGGIFTIARPFFARLGWYDEQLQLYGMENAELSLKGWMCGGRILTVPCSHVAHIRKRSHPFLDVAGRDSNVTFHNSVRVAEVWLDEHRQVVYDVNGIPGFSESRFGSVAGRKELRAQAQCRTFQYYLRRGYPEMPSPTVPGQFRGEVHNGALGNSSCLTAGSGTHPAPFMSACDKRNETQFWAHNFYRELNSYKRCLDVGGGAAVVTQALCHRMRGSQAWQYDVGSAQIRSVERPTHCLAIDSTPGSSALTLEPCAEHRPSQRWFVTLTKYDFWIPSQ